MWDYIVLGQVPGTSIQVSFENWLFAMACLTGSIILFSLLRRLAKSRFIAAVRIGVIIQHAGYVSWLLSRQHLRV